MTGPLHHVHPRLTPDLLKPEATYFFSGYPVDDRGNHPAWASMMNTREIQCAVIENDDENTISVRRNGTIGNSSFRDLPALTRFFGNSHGTYIDITGLPNHAWVPLLPAAKQSGNPLWVIYTEPEHYREDVQPATTSRYRLSERFGAQGPFAGLATIGGPASEDKTLFIALLGFEGGRARRLAAEFDPPLRSVPILGAPGFRLEYPQIAVDCNSAFLLAGTPDQDIRFADASSPFAARDVLNTIREDYQDYYLYVAPVGTKPHTLGAVLFALENTNVELMYDFPRRVQGQTSGVGQSHIYRIF